MFDTPETGPVQVPLFRVDLPGGPQFVDNTGRSYKNFEDWKANNRIPQGARVSVPKGGNLPKNPELARSWIETFTRELTSAEKAAAIGDTAAFVGGMFVVGAAVIGSGGAAIPIAAGALSAWNGYRSITELKDRADHGQSISITDPDARQHWLNLGASALGIASIGAGTAARAVQGTALGARYAPSALHAARWAAGGADALDLASFVDPAADLFRNWHQIDPSDRVAMVAQLGFWAGADRMIDGGAKYSSAKVHERLYEPLYLSGAGDLPVRYGGPDRTGYVFDAALAAQLRQELITGTSYEQDLLPLFDELVASQKLLFGRGGFSRFNPGTGEVKIDLDDGIDFKASALFHELSHLRSLRDGTHPDVAQFGWSMEAYLDAVAVEEARAFALGGDFYLAKGLRTSNHPMMQEYLDRYYPVYEQTYYDRMKVYLADPGYWDDPDVYIQAAQQEAKAEAERIGFDRMLEILRYTDPAAGSPELQRIQTHYWKRHQREWEDWFGD
jgi:hypothetical protein